MSIFAARNDRKVMRHAATLACEVVREADFCRIGTRTLDVSTAGMRVALDDCDEIALGDALFVALQVTPFGLWLDARARVARIVHGRRPTDRGAEIGLHFEDFSAVSKLILKGAVRKVPPPVPTRARRVDYAKTVRAVATAV